MSKSHLKLTTSQNPFQKSVIEGILRDAGIPFTIHEGPTPTVIVGLVPLAYEEFRVPAERLQEAKDFLCANGVVCEVSQRLLGRCLEEIVKPLIGSEEKDLTRLKRFVEVNNKETVKALFEATLLEPKGRELLEDLFFRIAREGSSPVLAPLARALKGGMHAGFRERFLSEATLGEKEVRLALISAAADLPPGKERNQALAAAMRDRDADLREAAGEALFAAGEDYGYDPEDPPGDREAAVKKLFETSR